MAKVNAPNQRWFKSGRINFESAGNIDEENGIIQGVIMCQVGEALGHGVWLEQSFIDDGISYAKKNHKKGMKARFGHPSMSNETLGSEMGRFREFRVEEDRMVADLHLFDTANLSPTHPGMRDWMIGMAKEDPAAIMCSIVFKPVYEYQYKDKKRINIWYCDKKGRWSRCRNQNGEVTEYNPNEKLYVELDEIHFCDIVDQGAATDKLFSEGFNQYKFSVIATQFLNEYPQLDEFIKENPEKLIDFIQKRHELEFEEPEFPEDESSPLGEMPKAEGVLAYLKGLFSKPKEQTKIDNTSMNFERSLEILGKENPTATELAEIKNQIEQFTGANEKFTKEELDQSVADALTEKQTELDQANTDLDQANTKVRELETEVEKLKEASPKPEEAAKENQEELEQSKTQTEESYSVKKANEDLGEI